MCQVCRENHEENLFQQPPTNEECPICFLTIPSMDTGSKHWTCCGKIICSGCIHAVEMMDDDEKCPFCRVPTPESDEEMNELNMKRVELNDATAIYNLGCCYNDGTYGYPQDWDKALELWHRAAELGNAKSYYNIGHAYHFGRGVEKDEERAKYYWELAAIGGNLSARYNLGILEGRAGNMSRALKHHMTAGGYGDNDSLTIDDDSTILCKWACNKR